MWYRVGNKHSKGKMAHTNKTKKTTLQSYGGILVTTLILSGGTVLTLSHGVTTGTVRACCDHRNGHGHGHDQVI